MAGASNTLFAKMTNRVYPRMPDFYGMIMDQCHLAVQVATLLEEYVNTGSKSRADQIALLEEQAEAIRERNMATLKAAFVTPMDREDIYRAFVSVDSVIPLASQIIHNMNDLAMAADAVTIAMVVQLRQAVVALQTGYEKLAAHPALADQDARDVLKARVAIEKIFRAGIAELFKCDALVQSLRDKTADSESNAVSYILEIFKRRELYRLLHDAGISVGDSGKVLHDIVVQVS